ncbi:MAG: ribosome maturation factor RimM [Acidimicrobiia bacterium]
MGHVGKPHGLRGQVHVVASTNREERFEPGAVLYAGDRALVVVAARSSDARHWVVSFDGVDSREAAEAMRGLVLTGDPLGALPDDELWVHELVGAAVEDRAGRPIGTVVAVVANPAHDLLELDGGALVPMVFVVEHTPGRVVIDPPEGLLELGCPPDGDRECPPEGDRECPPERERECPPERERE